MLRVADQQEIETARRMLIDRINDGATADITRNLTTPYGRVPNSSLVWRRHDQLWSYFAEELVAGNRWEFWYGTNPGEGPGALVPSIEINIPVLHSNKNVTGRFLVDGMNRLYLAHKGLLKGGGRGGVKMFEFEALIRGYEKEPIAWPDGSEERVFVIGALEAPDFIARLQGYVAEAERLRGLARAGRLAKALKDAPPHFRPGSHGKTKGKRSSQYEIDRHHDRIVNALEKALQGREISAYNTRHAEMWPDLYTRADDGTMELLFEVKTGTDTQSWYTAIGQLIVYGAAQPEPPRRVLVCPSPRQDPNFKAALETLDIALVFYREHDGREVSFEGLNDVVAVME